MSDDEADPLEKLVTEGQKDARTNEYATTDEARRMLERRTERRAAALGVAGGE